MWSAGRPDCARTPCTVWSTYSPIRGRFSCCSPNTGIAVSRCVSSLPSIDPQTYDANWDLLYISECSSKHNRGVSEVFYEAARVSLGTRSKSGEGCVLMWYYEQFTVWIPLWITIALFVCKSSILHISHFLMSSIFSLFSFWDVHPYVLIILYALLHGTIVWAEQRRRLRPASHSEFQVFCWKS